MLAASAVAVEIAAPAGSTVVSILDAAVAVAFAAGGATAAAASPRAADLALAVAAAWVIGTLAGLGDLPADLAAAAVLLHRAPLALLVLTYPGHRITGTVERALALAAVLAPFAPRGSIVTAAVAMLVAVAAAVGAARAAGPLRGPRSVAAAAGFSIALVAALAAAGLGRSSSLLIAYDLVLLATAAGLLGTLARGRWTAVATTGLVVELGAAPPGAPVTGRLAEVLRDPSLELRLRLRGGAWTDEAGRPTAAPSQGNGRRALIRRRLDDGTELALLHDPAAIPDRAAAESAVAVAATAVDNARHDRDVRVRIEHLRRLRRGLLDAADEERRQLELELRSGPLRAADELDRVMRGLPGDSVQALRGELALARRDLADIALGLHPGALLEHGLVGALSHAAARSPIPVEVHDGLGATELPAPIALTAYYVASEALTNIAKHSHATRARIELTAGAGTLHLRVDDDGSGRANPAGGGLTGLRERVRAVDGELHVHSSPGAGTVVEAHVPLPT